MTDEAKDRSAPGASDAEAAPPVSGEPEAAAEPEAEAAGAAPEADAAETAAGDDGGDAAAAAAKAAAAKAAAAKAAAAKAAAAKAAAAKAASAAAGGGEISRRGFFSWAAVAWVGFTAAIGGCVTAFTRFMYPNVLFEPPTSFKVGYPADFPPGVVDERFKESNGVWIVSEEGRLFALIAICTHLGCPPNWLEGQNKFKCPCHGSGYYKSGVNFEGPTPRPLERAQIAIDPADGQIMVEKSRKFQWELGQWDDPDSYIAVG